MTDFVHPRGPRRIEGAVPFLKKLREEFQSLAPDEVQERVPDEGVLFHICPGCERMAPGSEFVIRCGECSNASFPRLILFWGCAQCGGKNKALVDWAEHVKRLHPVRAVK